MGTALGLITSAMRKVGALTKNESPDSDEAADGLEMLNDLLASWSTESIIVNVRTEESFPLTSALAYTIGVGATFDTTPPVHIVSAYVRSGSTDYPLDIITDAAYAQITQKDTAGIPDCLNYNNGFPTATIKFHPAPVAGYTLYLVSEKPLTSFSLNDTVNLPPGWRRALIYNLAIEMAPEFDQPVKPSVEKVARQSKGAIARAVIKNKSMDGNKGGRTQNIYTGYNNQ